MFNQDINSRFNDWLLHPAETLDFEVKRWLDMTDAESHGTIAKALIALENNGGGFLLIGYMEDGTGNLIPDPSRPISLEPYNTDSINAIIKKRAEPAFHVEVRFQTHPHTAEQYPLVIVPGASKVPVRSDSATPNGTLKQNTYYIRASGPESRAPNSASEWDALIRRAIQKQREEIVSLIRTILPTSLEVADHNSSDEKEILHSFVQECTEKWSKLNNELADDSLAKIKLGYFSFAARVVGKNRNITLHQIIHLNESSRRYTGWPVFVTIHDPKVKPQPVDGRVEAWLAHVNYPDVGMADFWIIDPKGNFFLLRGYQEDSNGIDFKFGKSGISFELTLPVWRVGEFLLRISDLADVMFEDEYEVFVECTWTGIAGRSLFSHNHRRMIFDRKTSQTDTVTTTGKFSQQQLKDLLPDVVKSLTHPLYAHFDFFEPPNSFYMEEIGEMKSNSSRY